MDPMMWFATRSFGRWVPCPSVGADYGRSGFGTSMKFQNGGSHIRNSMNAAKTYNLEWSLTTRDNIRSIMDFFEGVYGPGPYYWGDPFAMDKNVLAQAWATPSIGGYDGAILNGKVVRPDLVDTPVNGLGYPSQSAVYSMASGDGYGLSHWVPLPPNYTAWIGVHGSTSGVNVIVRPTTGATTYAADVTPVMLPVTSATRVNTSISGAYTGVEVTMAGNGSCVLSGIIVQVLPNGAAPEEGGFISGQGHSGCDFSSRPSTEAYSVALERTQMSMSVNMEEVEQWRQ